VTIRGPLAWILAIVLLLSLAINVLIAGVVLGRMHAGPGPDSDDVQHIIGLIVRPYPPEIRRAFTDEALTQRGALLEKLNAMRDARREAFEAARAEPFDSARLDAAYANMRTAFAAMQQSIQRIEADAIARAPAPARREIKPPHGPFP
jgi:hypothetical protein